MANGDLLILPPRDSKHYRHELKAVVDKVNALFVKEAGALLALERATTGIKDLEVTLLLTERGLELAYCAPFKNRAGAPPPGQRSVAAARLAVKKAAKESASPKATAGRTTVKADLATGAVSIKTRRRRVP